MSGLKPADFAAFFGEIYKDKDGKPREPFPWQTRLAARVCDGDWPKCIALPTAAGKTACIDVAVFAMAYQAKRPPAERKAPRRVFFVVDRRVVVDQAYEHARTLAKKLDRATDGVLAKIADLLRNITAPGWSAVSENNRQRILTKRWELEDEKDESKRRRRRQSLTADEREWIDIRPLDYYALRGGMYRESAWVRSPLQPTIITSTVDQVGSRLLFRGYGVSDSSKPLHAALVGNDSLILLDEAHCSNPFMQTMSAVEKYRRWTNEPRSPFEFVSMSATPPNEILEKERLREQERPNLPSLILEMDESDRGHKTLGKRIEAPKPAQLVVAKKENSNKRTELVKELAKQARELAKKFRAVGVIVNRVATARELAHELDAVLLTGRMRPMDRDKLFDESLRPLLSNADTGTPPQFVVATQCLEVGADLDFHALVTECASLDALRQRFGRLNRVAARPQAEAVVVVRADQTEPMHSEDESDPVYGNSLANTWKWLNQNASEGVFDFGVAAVRAKTVKLTPDELAKLNAPPPDAAVLLPAHLDMWCQTYPIPMPDPDPAVFLHGPKTGMPDVQVVFRADLGEDADHWAEIVSLCPPSSSEALPVRLDVFRRWLAGEMVTDNSSDVEGERAPTDEVTDAADRRALRWHGPDSERTSVIASPGDVRPGETYVLPIDDQTDFASLGDFPTGRPTDQGDDAFQQARDLAILRLTPPVLNVSSLADVTADDDDFEEKLSEAIQSLMTSDRPDWIRQAANHLARKANRVVKPHPLGGFVVVGRKRLRKFDPTFIEAEESWASASGLPVPLANHCREVAAFARRFAEHAGLKSVPADALDMAGLLHDAGKADPRFQAWLQNGNRRTADLFPQRLAKSLVPMPTKQARDAARDRSAYPKGGRHELHSVRLAESDGVLPADASTRDLVLHLIASHHGCCRPFAPVIDDAKPEVFSYESESRVLTFTPDAASVSGHGLERLDSGVAERFWKLTRRFGWWGLPWLESMLRLADWAASDAAEKRGTDDKES